MDWIISTNIRFRVIGPSSEGPIEMDSWIVEDNGDNSYANRVIIRLGYKYMNEVVNDALYYPENCSLSFSHSSFDSFSMPMAVIKHGDDILYSIESYTIIQVDPIHFQYRDYMITVVASDGVNGMLHVVNCRNGFYKAGYDIVDQSVSKTLLHVYKCIDLELDKDK